MTHFYERNIVEIKTLYTSFLINIITPLIYEGIKSVYNNALIVENKFIEKGKYDPNIENPGILKIFQLCLKDIPTLNQHEIDNETSRIKEKSKCSEWFDDLIKAVVKSHIILLTYNASGKTCKTVKEKHHEMIKTTDFIHKCYIECARIFYNYPEIFYHKYSTLDIKRNQREAQEMIKISINEAIKKMLPIKLILQEYLSNDYMRDVEENIDDHMTESQYTNMSKLVKRDLNQNIKNGEIVNVFDNGSKHSTIVETTDDLNDTELNKNQEHINKNLNEISNDILHENQLNDKINNNEIIHEKKILENNEQYGISDNNKQDEIIYVKKPIKEKNGNNFFNELVIPMKEQKNEIKYSNKLNINESDDMNINIVRSVKDSNYSALFDDYIN
jgi:hypothetical protein